MKVNKRRWIERKMKGNIQKAGKAGKNYQKCTNIREHRYTERHKTRNSTSLFPSLFLHMMKQLKGKRKRYKKKKLVVAAPVKKKGPEG